MGVCRERATREARPREWSNTDIVKRQITAPARPATGLHLCCDASTCLRQTAIRASPLATICSSQGLPPLGPLVSRRVADGQSQSLRPAMSFPHPLPSAPSRLPRLSPLTLPALPLALSVQLPAPSSQSHVPYGVLCGTCLPAYLLVYLVYLGRQVGNLPGYVPYLSPACHLEPVTQSRCIFHPMALLSPPTVAVRSCLVVSRLVCPPTQWHPALFVAGSPLSGHGERHG